MECARASVDNLQLPLHSFSECEGIKKATEKKIGCMKFSDKNKKTQEHMYEVVLFVFPKYLPQNLREMIDSLKIQVRDWHHCSYVRTEGRK